MQNDPSAFPQIYVRVKIISKKSEIRQVGLAIIFGMLIFEALKTKNMLPVTVSCVELLEKICTPHSLKTHPCFHKP